MPEELDSRLSDAPAALTHPKQPLQSLGSVGDLGESVELSEISELVRRFAAHMFERIRLNKHKGLRKAWLKYSVDGTLIELQMNKEELRIALAYGVDVLDKAADVAVDALMIWDQSQTPAGELQGD